MNKSEKFHALGKTKYFYIAVVVTSFLGLILSFCPYVKIEAMKVASESVSFFTDFPTFARLIAALLFLLPTVIAALPLYTNKLFKKRYLIPSILLQLVLLLMLNLVHSLATEQADRYRGLAEVSLTFAGVLIILNAICGLVAAIKVFLDLRKKAKI